MRGNQEKVPDSSSDLDDEPIQPECLTAAVKFILAAMLLDCPMHLVRNFWDSHPLIRGKSTLEGSMLLRHLWHDEERIPLGYFIQVMNDLEPFLLRHGYSTLDLITRNLQELNSGSILPPKIALRTFRMVLASFLGSKDPRHSAFAAIPDTNAFIALGTRLWTVPVPSDAPDWHVQWLLLSHGSGYLRTLPALDPALWIEPLLRLFPLRLGLPELEDVEIVGEVRRLEEIVSPEDLERRGPLWFTHGEELSREQGLQVSCDARGFDAGAEGLPDLPVQVATRDWFCPIRQRIVVKAGRLYGCPSYILRLRYRKLDLLSFPNMLGNLIDEALSDGGQSWKRAAELFEKLVEDFGSTLRFVYHRLDESVTFNGSHLLRYTPAKILQKVLFAYTVTGREEFEHKEFRRDPDLGLDPNAPNLESRLKLLTDRLNDRCPALRIEKSGRGRFRLIVHGNVDFHEQDY